MHRDDPPAGRGTLKTIVGLRPVRRVLITLAALGVCGGLVILWQAVFGLAR